MPTPLITIHALRGAPAECRLRWGNLETYAPTGDIRATARDLLTCAAHADMITELLRIHLDTRTIGRLATAVLSGRDYRFFGAPTTVYLLPAGSTKRRQGMVLVSRTNQFHDRLADAALSPSQARAMARTWLACAETADNDTLYADLLGRALRLSTAEIDTVLDLAGTARNATPTPTAP